MSFTLFRYVARQYLAFFFVTVFAVLAVYLVADFGDRLKAFLDKPVLDVLELYFNKLLVALQQLAPAAMLLAAGATASTLRKRSEYTAMVALGGSPLQVLAPIAACAVVLGAGLTVFDDRIATHAGEQIDRLQLEKFGTWGEWRFFYAPRQWYRVGDTVLQLRGSSEGDVQKDVSVYTLDEKFRLHERLDAESLRPLGGDQWELHQVVARRFEGGEATRTIEPTRRLTLVGTSPDAFTIRTGKPEMMRLSELSKQEVRREKVGLSTQRYKWARHERFAYPATGVAAALLAVGLALRQNRRGHLTLALVEGLVVAVALWGTLVICKALMISEHIAPWAAAWLPMILIAVVMFALSVKERWVLR